MADARSVCESTPASCGRKQIDLVSQALHRSPTLPPISSMRNGATFALCEGEAQGCGSNYRRRRSQQSGIGEGQNQQGDDGSGAGRRIERVAAAPQSGTQEQYDGAGGNHNKKAKDGAPKLDGDCGSQCRRGGERYRFVNVMIDRSDCRERSGAGAEDRRIGQDPLRSRRQQVG